MRYGILFEVEIDHDYLLNFGSRVHEALNDASRGEIGRTYSVPSIIAVQPTSRARAVMAGHQMIFRSTQNGFKVGVRLDAAAPDSRPAVPLGDAFRIAFALKVVDPAFHNYTVVPRSPPDFFYLSNGSANEVGGEVFLSRPVPAFDAARRYEAGEVRAAVSGTVIDLFQARRDTGPSGAPVAPDWARIPADTFDPATTYAVGEIVLAQNRLFRALVDGPGIDLTVLTDWQPEGVLPNQYVTAADARLILPGLSDLDLSSVALTRATVRLTSPTSASPSFQQTYTAESGTLASAQVDARHLEPGAYDLEVLDDKSAPVAALGSPVYLDSEAVRDGWFGVIEIGLGAGGLALLDLTGALRSPSYSVRFLSRPTRWRYIFPADQPVGTGAEVAPEGGNPRVLVTDTPRPLTRFGDGIRLQDSVLVLLPEPGVERIRRESDEWFSEIHTPNLSI